MKYEEDKYRIMLSGYIDGELSPDEKAALEKHLTSCEECAKELNAFRKLKEVTGAMRYADIPEHVWDNYWHSLYRRLELGIGWVLLSMGAVLLLGCGFYCLIKGFFMDPQVPILVRIGVGAGSLGVIILIISAVRERFFAYTRDRYREIKR
jgi:predicted anti-sigma-YlaC factor YlaD